MFRRKIAAGLLVCLLAAILQGCASTAEGTEPAPKPTGVAMKADVSWPEEKLERNEDGVPLLRVYVVDEEKVETIDVETYVEGVLAGEMKNDWPLEALKAQAILARTFVLRFVEEKESKYPDADISTDIDVLEQMLRRDGYTENELTGIKDPIPAPEPMTAAEAQRRATSAPVMDFPEEESDLGLSAGKKRYVNH